ncbi:MAG: Crp/Fnr family transcriptional regulator [Alphaproteobacteria bacterium]
MAAPEVIKHLARAVLFNGLEESELRRLAAISRQVNLAEGAVLFQQGDESDGLYVVTSGILRIFLTAEDGREATVNLSEEGDVIGEMALLDGLPRSAGAAALNRATLVFIPRAPFLDLLDESSRVGRQIILTLCERLRAANNKVDEAMFHDLRYRLLMLLRQLAVMDGQVGEDMSVVDLALTQGTLAQMLGASREAVNKQLRALAREGRIAVDGHRIQIARHAKVRVRKPAPPGLAESRP